MTVNNSIDLSGHMSRLLNIEGFQSLVGQLVPWRLDPSVILMDRARDKGRVLGFVKGLRFSAKIAYLTRNILSTDNIEVSWGHLVDNKGKSCSPECDIIIHHPGHLRRWNGSEKPIMDFKFIDCRQALGIVSCKSLTRAIDKKYCETFKKYRLKNIFLFAECCNPKSVDRLTEQAKKAGYKGFYYLYTIDKDQKILTNEEVYMKFIKTIQALSKDRRG